MFLLSPDKMRIKKRIYPLLANPASEKNGTDTKIGMQMSFLSKSCGYKCERY